MTRPTPLAAFVKKASALLKNDAQQITLVRRRVVVDGVVVLVSITRDGPLPAPPAKDAE